MKKIINLIAILISLILLFFIIADIVNSQISYKYEIEESFGAECIDIKFASGYLKSKIRWLGYFSYYVIISIILFASSIFSNKK